MISKSRHLRFFNSLGQALFQVLVIFAFETVISVPASASVIFARERDSTQESFSAVECAAQTMECTSQFASGLLGSHPNLWVSFDSVMNSRCSCNLPDYPSEQIDWITSHNDFLLPLRTFSSVTGGGMGSPSSSGSGAFDFVIFFDFCRLFQQPPLTLSGRVYFFVNLDVPPAPAAELLRPPNGIGRNLPNT